MSLLIGVLLAAFVFYCVVRAGAQADQNAPHPYDKEDDRW